VPHLENFRLKAFRTVAENASFRKAGKELYLTQLVVTQQIKALEEDLGVQLFDRAATRVELISPGSMLLRHVQQVDRLLGRAEQEIAALNRTVPFRNYGAHSGESTVKLGQDVNKSTSLSSFLIAEVSPLYGKGVI
jgi:DNA-binding transcriptional LysR family regulator